MQDDAPSVGTTQEGTRRQHPRHQGRHRQERVYRHADAHPVGTHADALPERRDEVETERSHVARRPQSINRLFTRQPLPL